MIRIGVKAKMLKCRSRQFQGPQLSPVVSSPLCCTVTQDTADIHHWKASNVSLHVNKPARCQFVDLWFPVVEEVLRSFTQVKEEIS